MSEGTKITIMIVLSILAIIFCLYVTQDFREKVVNQYQEYIIKEIPLELMPYEVVTPSINGGIFGDSSIMHIKLNDGSLLSKYGNRGKWRIIIKGKRLREILKGLNK